MSRTVCVTGGASFIGSHLTEKLVECEYDVQVMDDFGSGKIEHPHNVVYEMKTYLKFFGIGKYPGNV